MKALTHTGFHVIDNDEFFDKVCVHGHVKRRVGDSDMRGVTDVGYVRCSCFRSSLCLKKGGRGRKMDVSGVGSAIPML